MVGKRYFVFRRIGSGKQYFVFRRIVRVNSLQIFFKRIGRISRVGDRYFIFRRIGLVNLTNIKKEYHC